MTSLWLVTEGDTRRTLSSSTYVIPSGAGHPWVPQRQIWNKPGKIIWLCSPLTASTSGSQDREKDGFDSVTENMSIWKKISLYTHTCMYMHPSIHACVYIWIYVYTHICTAVGKSRFAVVTFFWVNKSTVIIRTFMSFPIWTTVDVLLPTPIYLTLCCCLLQQFHLSSHGGFGGM